MIRVKGRKRLREAMWSLKIKIKIGRMLKRRKKQSKRFRPQKCSLRKVRRTRVRMLLRTRERRKRPKPERQLKLEKLWKVLLDALRVVLQGEHQEKPQVNDTLDRLTKDDGVISTLKSNP